ncbi:hypothetical protein AAHA92_06711 [Salvia divinorum]|uniref:Aspartic peptidase DDI1-type domain-containing protein n=1 Tax=Salvia divinorum TaxID=28513 RepID=A0ABD1I8X7_SALDI
MKNKDNEHASGPLDKSQRPLENSQRAAGQESATDSNSCPAQHNGIEIPRYAKLLREAVMKKHKHKKTDLKLPLHCNKVDKALCDLGASINIMPLEYYEKLNIGPLKTTDICLRLADNSTTKVVGRGEITISDNRSKSTYYIECDAKR